MKARRGSEMEGTECTTPNCRNLILGKGLCLKCICSKSDEIVARALRKCHESQKVEDDIATLRAERDELRERCEVLEVENARLHADYPLREELAALCHLQWTGWMAYLFSKCTNHIDGQNAGRVIPEWAVERWTRQMQTTYAALTEDEKESDRKEADHFLVILASAESAALEELAACRERCEALEESVGMACQDPRDDCCCPGCSFAAGVHAHDTHRTR